MEIRITSIEGLSEVVEVISGYIKSGYKVFLLSGDLGSGKTALTQSLYKQLGVSESITSPTFSLVNEYRLPSGELVYHMDLYRLEKQEDLVQIGFEEYLDSGQLCLIEWPELAESYFTMAHIKIRIDVETSNIRIFNITTHDAVDA
jgi:tRNA threonylcarbamoyladenosine biosynthesis protein TsaE